MANEEQAPKPGQLKHGFNMLARDLDRAFVMALLGTNEAVVLQAVREHSWVEPLKRRKKTDPMPDPMPCKINISRLAEKVGMDRSGLTRAHGNLVKARLLIEGKGGVVLINKDYRTWVYPATEKAPSRPRFTTSQIDYIRDAQEAGSGDKPVGKTVVETSQFDGCPTVGETSQFDGCPTVGETSHHENGGVVETSHSCCASTTVGVGETSHSHIEERARGDLERGDLNTTLPNAGASNSESMPCPPYPTERGLLTISTGPHRPTQEQAEYNWRILWENFNADPKAKQILCNGYYEHQQFYCHEAWLGAIREVYRRGKRNLETVAYIEKVAADYDAHGVPEQKPKQATSQPRARSQPPASTHASHQPLNITPRRSGAKQAP